MPAIKRHKALLDHGDDRRSIAVRALQLSRMLEQDAILKAAELIVEAERDRDANWREVQALRQEVRVLLARCARLSGGRKKPTSARPQGPT